MSGVYGTKVISDAAIATAARAGGFTGDDVVMATAIALAESGGDIYAYNPKAPDLSYGLMQINMIGDMGPERRKRFGLSKNTDLFNPAVNMRVAKAFKVSRGNWNDWSTYSAGDYKTYWNRARLAAGSPNTPLPDGATAVNASTGGVSGAASSLSKAADFLQQWQTWARLGMIVGGGILILVALSLISGVASSVKQAADTVTDVIPQTRAVKAAVKGAVKK